MVVLIALGNHLFDTEKLKILWMTQILVSRIYRELSWLLFLDYY